MLLFHNAGFAADCMDNALSQYDMNVCSGSKATKADAELNQVYQKLLMRAKKDAIATASIKNAERAWVKYRDAQIEMYYPSSRPTAFYGSFQPVCNNSLYQRLTEERIKELKEFLEKPAEGDMCGRIILNEKMA